jgi:hypothetical protein
MGDGGVAPPFLTSSLDGKWSATRLGCFTPGEGAPGTRLGLYAVEKRIISHLCRESNPGSLARSPSLYRLRYPGFIRKGNVTYLIKHHSLKRSEGVVAPSIRCRKSSVPRCGRFNPACRIPGGCVGGRSSRAGRCRQGK